MQPDGILSIGYKPLEGLEKHHDDASSQLTYSFLMVIDNNRLDFIHAQYSRGRFDIANGIRQIIEHGGLDKIEGSAWLDWEANPGVTNVNIPHSAMEKIAEAGLVNTYRTLCAAFLHHVDERDAGAQIKELLQFLAREFVKPAPKCEIIPAFRRAGTATFSQEVNYNYGGENLIHRLAELQHPDHDQLHLQLDFYRIRDFLREVTDQPSAEIEVPNKKDTLNVKINGRIKPLHALGTGIQEVIILAAAATTLHKQILCIEEPELHLHPLLQKKLLRYLEEQTDNQYFISTHSAHMLDDPDAAIFHVRLTETGSKIVQALEPEQRFRICSDLGYKASDLIQSNCIIWVEGPSDCIYVREWLRQRNDTLIEGVHYSIMFYGGRLLSHLSPDDPEVSNFISLRRLNRNMVVLMDCDKTADSELINHTKQRIIDEWGEQPGFPWLTAGREIENYVSGEALIDVQEEIAAKHKPYIAPDTPFTKAFKLDDKGKPFADKIKVARWLVEKQRVPFDRPNALDLEARINALHAFILKANHSEATSRPSEPKD